MAVKGVIDDMETDRVSEIVTPARLRSEQAVPWVLGLYGLAAATFVVASHMAGWDPSARSALFLFPFAAVLGGLATFLAGMWAYRTRDGLATAMLGTWGSFWMAYGVLHLLVATGTLTLPTGRFPAMGFWFIALAAITWIGALAASAQATALVTVFGFLAAASTLVAIADLVGTTTPAVIAGWLFIVAAIAGWYTASALLLQDAFGQEVLPLGSTRPARRLWPRGLGLTHAPQAPGHRAA